MPESEILKAEIKAGPKREVFTALNAAGYSQLPALIQKLIADGPAAVGFFFILSGFVLAHQHLRGQRIAGNKSEKAGGGAGAFYWGRFTRLYPAYLFAFLLFTPMAVQKYLVNPMPGSHRTFGAGAILSLLMVQSWTPFSQAWNGPGWSLSVEAFLYLVFPFIGWRLLRLKHKPTLAAISVAGWLIPLSFVSPYAIQRISERVWVEYVPNNPLLWLPLFAMGILATKLLPDWSSVRAATANRITIGVAVAVIGAALAWPARFGEIFITGGIAPLLVATIVCFTRLTGPLTRLIGGAAMNRLGQASYVVYILQASMWRYWEAFTNLLRRVPLQRERVALWQFVLFFPFLIGVSMATQHFVEEPVRNWLMRRKGAGFALPRRVGATAS